VWLGSAPVRRLVPQHVEIADALQLTLVHAVAVYVVSHPVTDHDADDDAKHVLDATRTLAHDAQGQRMSTPAPSWSVFVGQEHATTCNEDGIIACIVHSKERACGWLL